jgi:hypothetical protein
LVRTYVAGAEAAPGFLLHEVEKVRRRPPILRDVGGNRSGDRDDVAASPCPSPLRGEGTEEHALPGEGT